MDIDYTLLPKRSILCIDVKSFFASVEAVRRKIHPLDAYIIVIANINRSGSVVLAASPRVKKEFGIQTGSRAFEIPHDPRFILVEPSMKLYLKVNKMIIDILKRFVADEDLHIYSIDEAFLDVTASRKLFGNKFEVARTIQKVVFKELKLVVTIGIGDNPLLAKLALDNEAKNAANGLAYWSYENVSETIWKIELKDMWGISTGYIHRLHRLGIHSVYDLAHADQHKLKDRLGLMGLQLHYHAWGVDYSILSEKPQAKEKSFSKSQILLRDYYNEREIMIVIHEMVDEVAMRLRLHHVAAGKIALAISYSRDIEERGFTHQTQLPRQTNCTKDLNTQFEKLFKKYWRGQPIRQIYVGCGKLEPALYEQMDLFSTNEELEKKHALDEAMDEIRFRFGKSSIFWAHSLLPGGTFLKRSNHVGGHRGE
ncbi:DNA polymerase [Bacillus sp. PK3_68]|uniref:Y-family DNA polymerase n=1 Tax=Bacillus sp. PK3_68 TaxID=2027408 RepID=UPI000E7207BF|nr:DNA polymerase [Bacillus sp. PK3_68]RJS62384.1 DNA polymerase [Bacillus sp. PK3_68]